MDAALKLRTLTIFYLGLIFATIGYAQVFVGILGTSSSPTPGGPLWKNILNAVSSSNLTPSGTYAGLAIDWTAAGVSGGIPSGSWTQCGSTITATGSDQTAAIQSALNGCSANQYVLLASGTFTINTSVTVPSSTVLRGNGANNTILSVHGSSNSPIALGSNTAFPDQTKAVTVSSGYTANSSSIVVSSASNFVNGQYFVISELNLWPYVTTSGGPGGGNCTFCGIFNWGPLNGTTRSRMQTVHISGISGTTITFDPPLYTDYSHTLPNWASLAKFGYASYITNGGHYYLQTANNASPYTCTTGSLSPSFSTSGGSVSDGTCTWQDRGAGTTTQPQAIPFTASAFNAGVEDLQIYSNNTGYGAAINMSECAQCWVWGVETNYADGDLVDIYYGFRNTILSSYFSNAYNHGPGSHDSEILLYGGTSANLIANNIIERTHVALLMETGSAGNVVAENYVTGEFDSGSINFAINNIGNHAAHPQFNLAEGNIATFNADSTWGGSWQGTLFRNWLIGTNRVCSPQNDSRSTVVCSPGGYPQQVGHNSYYSFQAARGEVLDYGSIYYNSIGNVIGSGQQQALVNTSNNPIAQTGSVAWNTTRNYEQGYGYSLGYSGASDSGSFASDSALAQQTLLIHGDYSNFTSTTTWQTGITHTLPASFWTASAPSWWGGLAWPSIGPDVAGSGGPGNHIANSGIGNPAMNCYLNVMGGVDGGDSSPRTFSRTGCGW